MLNEIHACSVDIFVTKTIMFSNLATEVLLTDFSECVSCEFLVCKLLYYVDALCNAWTNKFLFSKRLCKCLDKSKYVVGTQFIHVPTCVLRFTNLKSSEK